jgi:hypothetical protein
VRSWLLAITLCACSGDSNEPTPKLMKIEAALHRDDDARMRQAVDRALTQVRRARAQRVVASAPCDVWASPQACGPKLTISRVVVHNGPADAHEVVEGARAELEGCLGSTPRSGRLVVVVSATGEVDHVVVPVAFGIHRDCMRGALTGKAFPSNASGYTIGVEIDFL